MRLGISDNNPTLSQILIDLRNQPGEVLSPLKNVTMDQVIAAAARRNVPIVEGRIEHRHLSNVYFEAARLVGIESR